MINKLKSFIFARVSILIKELLVAVWSMPSLGLALLSLLVGLYLEHYTAFIGGQLIVFFSILWIYIEINYKCSNFKNKYPLLYLGLTFVCVILILFNGNDLLGMYNGILRMWNRSGWSGGNTGGSSGSGSTGPGSGPGTGPGPGPGPGPGSGPGSGPGPGSGSGSGPYYNPSIRALKFSDLADRLEWERDVAINTRRRRGYTSRTVTFGDIKLGPSFGNPMWPTMREFLNRSDCPEAVRFRNNPASVTGNNISNDLINEIREFTRGY